MSTRSNLLDEDLVDTPASASQAAAREADDDRRKVWMPWDTTGCIATREQEIAFVDHLRSLGEVSEHAPADHSRGDLTACLNALRGGLTVGHLLELTPGLRPERLAAAYADLESRRGQAERAWTMIVASGSVSALVEHGESAGALLPAVIGRLAATAGSNPPGYGATVLRLAESVDRCRRDAYRVEHAFSRCSPGTSRGRQLSSLLYHPYGDSIATRDHFLADRVGMLTPTRVAALLGELDTPGPSLAGLA